MVLDILLLAVMTRNHRRGLGSRLVACVRSIAIAHACASRAQRLVEVCAAALAAQRARAPRPVLDDVERAAAAQGGDAGGGRDGDEPLRAGSGRRL